MKNKYLIFSLTFLSVIFNSTWGQDQTLSSPGSLKIVNWNVLYGFNHHKNIDEGVNWISKQNPDILGLQELNGNTSKSLSDLAKRWGHLHSVILKEYGFPVGLTSKKPIEVIEKRVEGFHHGFLHCKTMDIHFFVVHFWPGKEYESQIILDKISPLLSSNEKVIIMGDFNSHSIKDIEFHNTRSEFERRYSIIEDVENKGFIDLIHKHDKSALVSCPSLIRESDVKSSIQNVLNRQKRIDFIFTDESLSQHSSNGTIFISEELDGISDHYPVMVQFEFNK
jgi:exodeoxyribonuclease-3